jgi:hypothetical protein
MITIKSFACLSRLNPADPALPIIQDLLNTLIVKLHLNLIKDLH